jgi:aconitase A
MIASPAIPLHDLYEADETAWLDAMAVLVAEGRTSEFDLPNLQEYLESMAKRDRKEMTSRMRVLLAHLLKWEYQPDKRSKSWKLTILEQRNELEFDCTYSRTLRNHAEAELASVYAKAVIDAAYETGMEMSDFPAECPWTLEQLLADDDA